MTMGDPVSIVAGVTGITVAALYSAKRSQICVELTPLPAWGDAALSERDEG
jgi:hypothetical protein